MPTHRSPLRGLCKAVALISGAFILSSCQLSPASTLEPAGSHARNILDLLVPVAWAALAVFILVEGLLIYSVIRFRRRSQAMPVQVHGNTRIEVLWTIAPALIVLVIAVLTFRTQAINSRLDSSALRIEAVGHQWWFEYKYPEQGIVTANDIYVPVGRDVTVVLNAVDVIHNWWVPRLAGKTYMIPNNTNYLSFRAEAPGIYYGKCAEFCGEAHALMRFRLIALAPESFERWAAQQKIVPVPPAGDIAPATPAPRPQVTPGAQPQPTPVPQPTAVPPADPAARGQLVFIRKGCIGCHVINGVQQAKGLTGPNLTYFGNRTTIAAGLLENTPENLRAWLHNPGAIKPGNIMASAVKPGILSDQEINDLIAYLESMKFQIDMPVASNE